MAANDNIDCPEHGKGRAAYVCTHIFETLNDGVARGFHWVRDEDDEIQAFCDVCWDADDEAWEQISAAGPRLLCLECLKKAADINDLEMDLD